MKYLNESCLTCKKLNTPGIWGVMPESCAEHLKAIWGEDYDKLIEEFSCDFYVRKNSGAFRRHCRKERRAQNAEKAQLLEP